MVTCRMVLLGSEPETSASGGVAPQYYPPTISFRGHEGMMKRIKDFTDKDMGKPREKWYMKPLFWLTDKGFGVLTDAIDSSNSGGPANTLQCVSQHGVWYFSNH